LIDRILAQIRTAQRRGDIRADIDPVAETVAILRHDETELQKGRTDQLDRLSYEICEPAGQAGLFQGPDGSTKGFAIVGGNFACFGVDQILSLHEPRAFDQTRSHHVVPEIGDGFRARPDRESLRHRAEAETGDLREDEPHPMRRFQAVRKLFHHPIHETLEIERAGPVSPSCDA
jgi:hypothetical protein